MPGIPGVPIIPLEELGGMLEATKGVEAAAKATGKAIEAGEMGKNLMSAAERVGVEGKNFLGTHTEKLEKLGKELLTPEEVAKFNRDLIVVDREMGDATDDFKKKAAGILGEEGSTRPEKLPGNINQNTKDFLKKRGYEDLAEDLTASEQKNIGTATQQIRERSTREAVLQPIKGMEPNKVFENATNNSDVDEALELLLRVALKLSAKLVSTIARSIANDKNSSPETRMVFKAMADLIDEGAMFGEVLITGQEHPNLKADITNFVSGLLHTKSTE